MAKRMLPIFLKARGSVVTVISPDNYNFGGGDILHPLDFIEDLTSLPVGDTIYTCAIDEDDYGSILEVVHENDFELRFEK